MIQKKYPCCKAQINEDEIWNLIEEDTSGVTNKIFTCPYCSKSLICYLNLESLEVEG